MNLGANHIGPRRSQDQHPADVRVRRAIAADSRRFALASWAIALVAMSGHRVAVIDAYGKPAVLSSRERFYEKQLNEHPIIGVYGLGARASDVVEDLRAAGL